MGLLNSGKKALKFTFVTMPSSMLGINQLRMGNQHISSLWRSLVAPRCPECEKGVLSCYEEGEPLFDEPSGRPLYPWICNKCDYRLYAQKDQKTVEQIARNRQKEIVLEQISDIDRDELESIANKHRLQSRIFYAASCITFFGFLYMIANGASLIATLQWLSICFCFWVFGLKRAYRYWQVTTVTIFKKGAFGYWFRNGRWFV